MTIIFYAFLGYHTYVNTVRQVIIVIA